MWDAAVFRAVQDVFEQKCQHNALPLSGITGFMRSNYPSNYPLTLFASVSESLFGLGLCLSVAVSVTAPGPALLEDRQAGEAGLVRVNGGAGRCS